jgi:hypothetical protein
MSLVAIADQVVMARVLAGTLLAFFALAASAWAADTTVGSGTTAWGDVFTLRVTTEKKTPGGPVRCLAYEDASGGGAGCPLERPPADTIDTQTDVSCGSKRVAIYGALDARVARVVVRLVGGRTITGTRFDPVAAIDPQMAYWIVTFKGLTPVRSITAIAADGSVLARDRDTPRPCEDEHEFHGRRYEVARFTDPDGTAWRLEGYRGLIRDDGRLQRTLCFDLRQALTGDPFYVGGVSGACGVTIEPGAKALAVVGDGNGCGAGSNLILYGLARAKVARIVVRSKAGWKVAVPRSAPRGLRTVARVWAVAVRWPASGVVVDAQDRLGRTIAKDRLKPLRIPGGPACPGGSLIGTI